MLGFGIFWIELFDHKDAKLLHLERHTIDEFFVIFQLYSRASERLILKR